MAEPYCLAMVLCDGVHRDHTTGKFTLLGLFSTIHAEGYPAKVQFIVYSAITDGHGEVEIRLELVNAGAEFCEGEERVVFESKVGDIEFSNPLMVFESVIVVQAEIPAPGLYHCELYANQTHLMSRRLLAIKHTNDAGQEGESHDRPS